MGTHPRSVKDARDFAKVVAQVRFLAGISVRDDCEWFVIVRTPVLMKGPRCRRPAAHKPPGRVRLRVFREWLL